MNPKRSVLARLALPMAALGVLLAVLYEWGAGRPFAALRETLAERDARIVRNLFLAQGEVLASDLDGYAFWTDAYDLVQTPEAFDRAAWLAENLTADILATQSYEFFVWLMPDGEEVAHLVAAESDGTPGAVPAPVLALARPGGALWPVGERAEENVRGLLRLDGRLAVVASNPVRPTVVPAPPGNSRMVTGRWIDRRLADMAIAADMPLYAADDPAGQGAGTRPIELVDLTGAPLTVVRIAPPILHDRISARMRLWFYGGLGLAFAVFGIVFAGALDRMLLTPLAAVQADLAEIVRTGDHARRVRAPGPPAFGPHAAAINAVIGSLEAAETGLARRLDVERAISEVALRLRQTPGNAGVAASLAILSRRLDVDVLSYFEIVGGDAMHCIGHFRNGTDYSGAYEFDAPVADWVVRLAAAGRPLAVADAETYDDADNPGVREFIGEYDMRSLLAVPLPPAHGRARGVVAFGHIARPHIWSAEDIRVLDVVAQLFSHNVTPRGA